MSRNNFRESVCERDGYECRIPWCVSEVTPDPDGPGEQHHILDKELWPNDGYIVDNGVNVCNDHHRMAEQNEIPPQAFYRWAGIEKPPLPTDTALGTTESEHGVPNDVIRPDVSDHSDVFAMNKWGESFETPPHSELRTYPKYPSTRHLLPLYWQSERGTAEQRTGRDDTGLTSVEHFLDIPLVVTIKCDGSNTMLVKDSDEPVRARNGRDAEHESFDHLKQEYWDRNVYEHLPPYLQVFGENMYACHSIHYGCDGCHDERNQGPPVDDVFLVFGVYDTRYDLWLSWPETEQVAEQIGFQTVPVVYHRYEIDTEQTFVEEVTEMAETVVDDGHEGIIVRSRYPFHYDQFSRKLGKYVRPNHVQTDEHWSHQETVRNEVVNEQ